MIWRKLLNATIALAMACALFSGCAGAGTAETPESPADAGLETEDGAVPAQPQEANSANGFKSVTFAKPASDIVLDPIRGSDGFSVELLGNTIGGLYGTDNDGVPQPDLAQSVQVSDDGLTYTFTIREAQWNNGAPLTARDFVYAWRRLADPASGTEYAYLVEEAAIKNAEHVITGEIPPEELGVSAPDDRTFVVELELPLPYFPSLVSYTAFAPLNEEFVTSQGTGFALTADNLLACGPYYISEWDVAGNTISMRKNESYYDAQSVDIDEVNFRIVGDVQQGVMAYENGDLDYITLSGDLVERYVGSEGYSSELGNFNWYLYFNSDVVDNEAMRQAMGYAVDRDALVNNVLKDGSIVQNNLVMTNLAANSAGVEFNAACGPHYQVDRERAKELWEQARGETELRKLTLTYEEDSEFISRVAAFVQSELEGTLEGLEIELLKVPKSIRLDNMEQGDFDFALHRWGPDYADPTAVMSLFTSSSIYNYAGYSDARYDALLRDAGTTHALDEAARWNALIEAEHLVMDSAVAVPLFQIGDAVLLRPGIGGYNKHFTGVGTYYKYLTMD